MAKYKIVFDPTIANGDSIASYLIDAAGAVLTSTLVGGTQQSLDVNVTQSALPTGAATETTLATLATEVTAAAILAELQAIDNIDGAAWSAGSTGIMGLAVRADALGPLSGVDDGDFSPLQVDANGLLKVAATVDMTGDYLEDSAAVSGDAGLFSLAVRRNAGGSQVSADGDYAEFQVSGTGELRAMNVQNTAVLQTKVTLATGGTAQKCPATPLANRKKLWVQNISDKPMFFGASTVTSSGATRGYEIDNGGSETFDLGHSVDLWGICATSSKDLVVLEFS